MTAPVLPLAAGGSTDVRVTFSSAPGEGTLDGAWWPRSTELLDELPQLIRALPASAGWIVIAAMAGEGWPGARPTTVPIEGRHALRLGWFIHMPGHTMTLTNRLGDRLTLMVIWPDSPPEIAERALKVAASRTDMHAVDLLTGSPVTS